MVYAGSASHPGRSSGDHRPAAGRAGYRDPATGGPDGAADQSGAETGFCIAGRLRTFWKTNGGLPVFGFSITEQREEVIEGQPVQVQWFERPRFKLYSFRLITLP